MTAILLIAIQFFFYSSIRAEEGCAEKADIIFLVDSSGSLKTDYDKELQFVSKLSEKYEISETGTHAAAVFFSDIGKFTTSIGFNTDGNSFKQAILSSTLIGYRTRIDLALRKSSELLENRNRADAKKTVFLLTDGAQNPITESDGSSLDPVEAANHLRDDGVEIYCIGFGNKVDIKQLNAICKEPSKVLHATHAVDLISDDFVSKTVNKICPTSVPKTVTRRITRGTFGVE